MAAATLLAQQGARVLLLDRATFPAPTVSCPVFYGNSLAVFERMGVLDEIEAIGAPRIRYYGGRSPELDLVARLPAVYGRDYAYSIRREVLDTAVMDRVREYAGITVREGFAVTDVVWGGEQVVGVRGRQNGGSEEVLYARAVVGADGKRSRVARAVGAPVYDSRPSRSCIFYAYYRDFEPLDEPSAVVYVDPDEQTSVLVFDADDGLTVVSVGVPAEQFDEARSDPEGTMVRTWQRIPEVAHRARNATRATQVKGQAAVESFYRQSYGPGWALVGDAGHYIDPITGQGINNALHSAEYFAEAWARTRRRASWMGAMAGYQRRRDAATRPMYDLLGFGERMRWTAELGIDIGTPLFRAIARRPEIASQYVGMYNGATSVNRFLHPLNLLRILLEDQLYYQMPQQAARLLDRSPLVRLSQAG
jgi:2-polyprenyl-6-methoxyphenol hydroxylase-like FAD-dependent oxidoreductase